MRKGAKQTTYLVGLRPKLDQSKLPYRESFAKSIIWSNKLCLSVT